MSIGRRPAFFFVLALINLALIPITPSEFRWLNVAMAALAAFWSIVLGLEEVSSQRDANRRRDEGRNRFRRA